MTKVPCLRAKICMAIETYAITLEFSQTLLPSGAMLQSRRECSSRRVLLHARIQQLLSVRPPYNPGHLIQIKKLERKLKKAQSQMGIS